MKSFVEIREEAESFLSYVFKVLEQAKCDVSGFDLDHICYRVVTVDEYLRLKKLLLKEGVLLADNHWNGREISKALGIRHWILVISAYGLSYVIGEENGKSVNTFLITLIS